MRTIPVDLAAEYAKANGTIAAFLQITRRDGMVERYTSIDVPVTLTATTPSGIALTGTYTPVQGLDLKALVSSASLAAEGSEVSIIAGGNLVDEDFANEIITGRWDFASYVLFEANPLDPADGIFVLKRGTTGEAQPSINSGVHTIEARSLKQALQQPLGVALSKTCRYRFAVYDGARNLCPVDIADYTYTVTVSAVASRQVFTVTGAPATEDWLGEGSLLGLTGDNDGEQQAVKSHTAAGVVTLKLPMPYTVQVGDTFEAKAGCRLRFEPDCRDKFDVAIDFGGEPHIVGVDHLTSPSDIDV